MYAELGFGGHLIPFIVFFYVGSFCTTLLAIEMIPLMGHGPMAPGSASVQCLYDNSRINLM